MLSSLVQRAQSIIDQTSLASNTTDQQVSKSTLFREQFRLPESQTPIAEISAEFYIPSLQSSNPSPSTSDKAKDNGTRYIGDLHLSESFLCFSTLRASFLPSASHASSTTFTGQTGGAGPGGHGFTIPLCAIRRVERLNSQPHVFNLGLTVWDKHVMQNSVVLVEKQRPELPLRKLILNLEGSRQSAERFCDYLKKSLRESMREVDSLKSTVADCYSEYLLDPANAQTRAHLKESGQELPPLPDIGLGQIFRYQIGRAHV